MENKIQEMNLINHYNLMALNNYFKPNNPSNHYTF